MDSQGRPDWAARLRVRQSALPAANLDGLVVSALPNIRYLTGFDGSAGALVVTKDEAILISDGRYALAIQEGMRAGALARVRFEQVSARYDLTLVEVVKSRGLKRVGFEAAHVTVAALRAWRHGLDELVWVETDDLVERQRLIKDAWEQEVYRRGGLAIASVAARLGEWVRPGRSEKEIARLIERGLEEAGFSKPAFATIVASGPNSAYPHARPTTRLVESGDLVVLDFGGVLDGYCLDLTRMCGAGRVSPAARALVAAVQEAHHAAVEAVRPGVEARAIDQAARNVFDAHGLGQAFQHGTGHGLGLEVHEAPRIARVSADPPEVVEAGMVFTIEPGAYVPGVGGVRLEDDVLVTSTGCEVLTGGPRELLVV
jgi:Xaa-Pro aminopeptidase